MSEGGATVYHYQTGGKTLSFPLDWQNTIASDQ
jgi:hypothetical protein